MLQRSKDLSTNLFVSLAKSVPAYNITAGVTRDDAVRNHSALLSVANRSDNARVADYVVARI